MKTAYRLALANLPYPASAEASVGDAVAAIASAGASGADVICFPECFVPGYRGPGKSVTTPDRFFLDYAWELVADAARKAGVAVVLGTERIHDGKLLASALVVGRDGTRLGFQDKTQVAPEEERTYAAADTGRHLFESDGLKFGVAICHEGWRYPETVRWPARRGAQVVFHPHFHEAQTGGYQPAVFADPANTFHEKAALCRAAENTCYFATVNHAAAGSPSTSAVIRPDGTVLAWQPYGQAGLLSADIDVAEATGLLARRLKD